jgi:DNA-3-methyladenine glycosylase II
MKAIVTQLTDTTFQQAISELCKRDEDLAQIFDRIGPPPMWVREPGFPTLVRIILEQQVSLASAKAAYDRLLAKVSPLTAGGFLTLSDEELKQIGFSRQKTGYCRNLAQSIQQGKFDPDNLHILDDETVRRKLTDHKGIGAWTAEIYLLMALRRRDVWPRHDLALAVAVQQVKKLNSRPSPEKLEKLSIPWKPWRAVAARMLWHHYLNNPK